MEVNSLKYYIRGNSSKSHQKKRVEKVNLPVFNKLVEVYPRFINGNEKLNIRKGIFVSETTHLLFFKSISRAGKLEAFSKSDLIYKIYIYDYVNLRGNNT